MKPGIPKKLITPALALVIFFQIIVMGGVYLNARLPLWTGKEILLNTRPVDPRSLFRGNYARLSYDISSLPAEDIRGKVRTNEVVYVLLATDKKGVFQYKSASLTRPDSGIFIRGRIKNRSHGTEPKKTYRINYGIEAFFAPKEKALALEKQLRQSALARIFVLPSGRAALKEIHGP